jgi:hypothetical protein
MAHSVWAFLTLTNNDPGQIARSSQGMWTELTRPDIERVKKQLQARRSEILARHAAELTALDLEETELTVLEEAIDALVRKFGIGGAEVVPLKAAAS